MLHMRCPWGVCISNLMRLKALLRVGLVVLVFSSIGMHMRLQLPEEARRPLTRQDTPEAALSRTTTSGHALCGLHPMSSFRTFGFGLGLGLSTSGFAANKIC
eukprot:4402643-Amphidinium_carterae.1